MFWYFTGWVKTLTFSWCKQKSLNTSVLTVVDLKVMDSQSFEDSHTGFMDVQGVTQVWVWYAVHSANLGGGRGDGHWIKHEGRQKEEEETDRQTGTCMWSSRRKACSFLYSLEGGVLSPNVKLTNQRWRASFRWRQVVTTSHYKDVKRWFLLWQV